jgi:hypothetical protein
MKSVVFGMHWGSPGYYAGMLYWLADISWGCGTHACHFSARLLGLEIHARIYDELPEENS